MGLCPLWERRRTGPGVLRLSLVPRTDRPRPPAPLHHLLSRCDHHRHPVRVRSRPCRDGPGRLFSGRLDSTPQRVSRLADLRSHGPRLLRLRRGAAQFPIRPVPAQPQPGRLLRPGTGTQAVRRGDRGGQRIAPPDRRDGPRGRLGIRHGDDEGHVDGRGRPYSRPRPGSAYRRFHRDQLLHRRIAQGHRAGHPGGRRTGQAVQSRTGDDHRQGQPQVRQDRGGSRPGGGPRRQGPGHHAGRDGPQGDGKEPARKRAEIPHRRRLHLRLGILVRGGRRLPVHLAVGGTHHRVQRRRFHERFRSHHPHRPPRRPTNHDRPSPPGQGRPVRPGHPRLPHRHPYRR